MSKAMRGIFAIPCTPMTPDLKIDEGALENIIDYIAASGAHGIVTPVNASEFTVLTDEERMRVVEVGVKANKGRLPFVAGVAGVHVGAAVMFAKHAKEAGADALIAMPPYLTKASEREILAYYEAISDAAGLPIFIQNYIAPIGTPMSAAFMAKLVSEIEHVSFVKEETQFASHVITDLIGLTKGSDKFLGVMGGKAGRYLIDEYNRGCCGNMPACEICDVQAKIWNKLEAGDESGAVGIYNRVIPLLNMEYQYGSTLYKEVLRRRGVIAHADARTIGRVVLDGYDKKELDRIMDDIKEYFAV